MAKIEFEWRISDPDPAGGFVYVSEHLVGYDKTLLYGPMPPRSADSFIKARRQFVHRRITTKFAALQLFESRPHHNIHQEPKARQ